MNDIKDIRQAIRTYFKKSHTKKKFIAGETPIPVSGKVFDEQELLNGVSAVLDGWWTEGRFAKEFEQEFGKHHSVRYVSLVNSGSSANLCAFSALTSYELGEKRIRPGDEVITAATGFPTTVNPIIQHKCVPVFVDVDLHTRNALIDQVERAITTKTKAIVLAHTLGNPFDLSAIVKLAKKNNLWFIEDCCDALGSTYQNRLAGTFGDIATFSFYPAHQITMGEGGAVITNNSLLHRGIRQFRDWGRDCWCDTGKDNTCGKRFAWKMGDLPFGYDHKYIYSKIGYNLKLTDMQAAIGLAQLKKLSSFIKSRRMNFNKLYQYFIKHQDYFILPKWDTKTEPSWFGFMLIIRPHAPFSRLDIVRYLESKKIATRSLFGGNLVRHPAYKDVSYRVVNTLTNSDLLMNNGFWIGVYPGITGEMVEYVKRMFDEFITSIAEK